ncbi:UPF0669 protein v1g209471-like [Lycorma delicatula]|uniref:UPF0669 protein v1g209471-like n=1 Tax=Lycorma delicatula TaxID=130591 RepID=UPI003F51A5AB
MVKIFILNILIVSILCYLIECNGEVHLQSVLQTVSGEVGAGNFSYYSLMYIGPITLFLYSSEGDADLYVSQEISKPTFEPDSYCLQSATCGVDIIDIPKSFQRPVSIGVYGHPSHDISTYVLKVVGLYTENSDEHDSSDTVNPDSTIETDTSDLNEEDRLNNPEVS